MTRGLPSTRRTPENDPLMIPISLAPWDLISVDQVTPMEMQSASIMLARDTTVTRVFTHQTRYDSNNYVCSCVLHLDENLPQY